ncbi:T9SS type A sorting domain-containing protein [Chryseobacterium sp. MP_3.2]|uniref:T9SS type A sorting domain-containing protein n=1 Tax=Chryseobacterium sp. MP_3.2 TaxID=3071712 RepID=UPI002E1053C3
MKNYYIILFSACSSVAFSQTIITKSANDYLIGNTINSENVMGFPDNSSTGSGVTFNNSLLTSGTSVVSLVSAPSAAELTEFPGTTVKFDDGNGNSIFYKSSATQLEITGAGISGATLNFSADNAIFLKFPTSFSNTYNDTARGTFSNGTVSGLFRGTIATTGDATGTLLLGSDTFGNILRIKSVQNYNLYQSTDTNYFFPIGTLSNTIFTYYDNLNRYPLFTTTTATIVVPLLSINQTTNAAVRQVNPNLATVKSNKNDVKVYPNPVKNNLFFAGALGNYSAVKIYSLEGKLVKSETISNQNLDLSKLPSGNYIVELSSTTEKSKIIHIIKD